MRLSLRNGKNYPPIEIQLENGKKLEIEGKIDRADFAKTPEGKYLRIIDYKSSVKNLDLNEIEYGLQLQLFTYLDAMCKQEDFLPAGVLYFSLIDPIIKADQRMTKEEIAEEIRKRFKMQGFVLADVKIIKMMDQTFESGSSNRVPVYLDKEGNISPSRSNCLTKEQFQILQRHIEKTIQKIGMEMTQGKIQPNPYYQLKDQKTPCKYCPYHGICQIDDNFGQITYRYIPNQKKEVILEKLAGERKEESYENKLSRD